MDTGDDEDEERRGGEDIAKVKDNEIERPDDDDDEDEVEDSLGSAATGNFRVKKSRGKEEEVWMEVAHCHSAVWQDMESTTAWGSNLSRRFCKMFSEGSPRLLGQHGSCSAAQRPGELSENILQNLQNKLPPKTVYFSVHATNSRRY